MTTSPEDLVAIRKKALNFGKLVLNFLAKQVLAPVEDLSENGPREARGFFSSPFRQPQERQEGGGGESEGNRNRVIDWVARLIGVQGKTLGVRLILQVLNSIFRFKMKVKLCSFFLHRNFFGNIKFTFCTI